MKEQHTCNWCNKRTENAVRENIDDCFDDAIWLCQRCWKECSCCLEVIAEVNNDPWVPVVGFDVEVEPSWMRS